MITSRTEVKAASPLHQAPKIWHHSNSKAENHVWGYLAAVTLFLALQFPLLLYLGLTVAVFCLQFLQYASGLVINPWVQSWGGIRTLGAIAVEKAGHLNIREGRRQANARHWNSNGRVKSTAR